MTADDFEEAKEKMMMGSKRQLVISDKEREIVAYHEAGHALAFELIPEIDPLHKVTILPQGRGLGVTIPLPEERYLQSRSYCLGTMAAALGGREAEQIVFGEVTSGAQNDIEQVTRIARHMVCDWGMSEELGATALGEKEHEVFLGRDIAHQANYSETTAHRIDNEIQHFVTVAGERVEKLLKDYESELHIVAKALLERDTLSRDEVAALIAGETLPPLPPDTSDSDESKETGESDRSAESQETGELQPTAESQTTAESQVAVEGGDGGSKDEAGEASVSESKPGDGNGAVTVDGREQDTVDSQEQETVETPDPEAEPAAPVRSTKT